MQRIMNLEKWNLGQNHIRFHYIYLKIQEVFYFSNGDFLNYKWDTVDFL